MTKLLSGLFLIMLSRFVKHSMKLSLSMSDFKSVFYLNFNAFLCATCVSELLRRLITEKDELVEEVNTLRETLRVS